MDEYDEQSGDDYSEEEKINTNRGTRKPKAFRDPYGSEEEEEERQEKLAKIERQKQREEKQKKMEKEQDEALVIGASEREDRKGSQVSEVKPKSSKRGSKVVIAVSNVDDSKRQGANAD